MTVHGMEVDKSSERELAYLQTQVTELRNQFRVNRGPESAPRSLSKRSSNAMPGHTHDRESAPAETRWTNSSPLR